jgi:hypothetical protein
LKPFWKKFIIPDAIKNTRNSWEAKISTLTGVWKELIPRVQDFSGESNCRCGGNSMRTRIRSGS